MSGEAPWERFARSAPEAHIASRRGAFADEAAREAFYGSGRRDAAAILALTRPFVASRVRAVDIGAGVGRVAFAMASHFDAVVAVDASPTMLALLEERAAARGLTNIACAAAGGSWDAEAADLVYSVYTLQHLARSEVARYVERTARALAPGGAAFLQLDTRPASAAYRLRNTLPDAALPRAWRRGMRTIRKDRSWLRALFEAAGLSVVDEVEPATRRHAFVVRKR